MIHACKKGSWVPCGYVSGFRENFPAVVLLFQLLQLRSNTTAMIFLVLK